MTARTWWETVEAQGGALLDQLKNLLSEGNIRRVRVRQRGRLIAEFPLAVGVVGAVFAPVLAAIGALIALLADCSLEVERMEPVETDDQADATPAASTPEAPPAIEAQPPPT